MYKCEKCDKEFDKIKALQGHQAWHVKRNGLDIIAAKERHKIKKEENENMYYGNPYVCKNCNNIIPYKIAWLKRAELKKGAKHTFCGSSCAAFYNNTHKTHGTTVSKLERWVAEKLTALFPSLEVHYNRKDAINSELDIYIPSLKLSFELNGILHYKPIFGEEKLESIQNNDRRKTQACLEKGIKLCVIDTSKHSYVTESTCKPYLDIMLKAIELKSSSPQI